MTLLPHGRSMQPARRWALPLFGVLATVLVALLLGAASALFPVWFLAAVLFLPAFLAVAFVRPEYGLAITVALVSELVHPAFLPRIPFLGGTVQAGDISLGVMVIVVLVRSIFPGNAPLPYRLSLTLPVLALFAVAGVSALYAKITLGVGAKDVLGESRHFIYLLLAPLVVAAIRDQRQLERFLVSLMVVGILFGVGQILQGLGGIRVFGGASRLEYLETLGSRDFNVLRSLTHGLNLIFLSLLLLAAKRALGALNPLVFMMLAALLLGALAATFGRTTWATGFVICLAFISFLKPREAGHVVSAALLAIALTASLTAVVRPQVVEAVWTRATSVGDELKRGQSMAWRRYEAAMVLPQVAKSPLLGIGLGNAYRPHASSDVTPEQVRYLHNSFLYIAAKLGILGAAAWLAILFQLVRLGISVYRTAPTRWEKLVAVSLLLCVSRMMVSGYTEPWLMLDAGLAFVAIALAIVVCMSRRRLQPVAEATPIVGGDSSGMRTIWGKAGVGVTA